MSSSASVTVPGGQHDLHISKPLYPVILATILICTILTTTAVAARLITKHIVASFNVEDCEFSLIFECGRKLKVL